MYGCYKSDSGDYITYEVLDKAFGGNGETASDGLSGLWNHIRSGFDNTHISAKEAVAAHELGLYPPTGGCDCTSCNTYSYTDEDGTERTLCEEVAEDGTVSYYYDTKEHWWESSNKVYVDDFDATGLTSTLKITDVGNECEKFLKYVIKSLKKESDSNFDTYTPYIESVRDHWFRNVYFVNRDYYDDDDKYNIIGDFVDYDYQYELVTGERWTMYETYEIGHEKEGQFKYYVMNEDGSTSDTLYEGNVISGESSIGYDGEPLTDKDGNPVTERLAARGEDGTLVVKKAVTLNLDEKYEDLGWNKSGERYIAYDPDVGEPVSEYEQMYTAEEIAEVSDDLEKAARTNMYVELKITQINQTGEGLRTETNPKIKKMFMSNQYFKYDGSQQTAEIIYALREKITGSKYDGYGPIDESLIYDGDGNPISYDLTFDKYPDGKYTSEAQNGEYKLSEYVGNVSFQQDALNTFAMMENSHTLDADYIYRDFKELVVELGYFEKEELTESKPKLLQWIVPEIGSAGYPDRSIDKRDEEYGTMVHSKSDIDANKKQTIYSLIAGMGSEIPEEINAQQAAEVNDSISGLLGNESRISISEVGAIKNEAIKTPAQVSLTEFLDTTREMCEYINEVGYDYCVLVTCDGDGDQNCHHDVHGNDKCSSHSGSGCGLPRSFEDSKTSDATHNFCCATLVSWALQNVGVMPDSHHLDGANSLAEYIMKNLDPEVIEVGATLQEGDILCYEGHIDIVGKEISGGFEKYNGGHYTDAGSIEYEGTSCIEKISGWPSDSRIKFALRLNWGKNKPAVYEGYLGNEAVVSPVTGILREYGTYDAESAQENRENMDLKYGGLLEGYTYKEETVIDPETGEETKEIKYPYDKVGYAVIEVLDAETYRKLETEVDNRWNPKNGGTSLVKINEKSVNNNDNTEENVNKHISFIEKTDELLAEDRNWTNVDETVYAYKEFAEQYERFGIAGYYIYIDGFKCEEVGETEETEEGGEENKDNTQERSPKITKPGDPLTFDSFKISPDEVNRDDFEPDTENLYEADSISKLISEEMFNKLKAESSIKSDASTGITFTHKDDELDDEGNHIENTNEYVLIKEGTVLGRTLTDEEVVDFPEYRNKEYGSYEEYLEVQKKFLSEDENENTTTPATNGTEGEGQDDENLVTSKVPLMGNYLRIIMQEPDGSIVENVEEYMKLDEVKQSTDNDWELFFWLPFESGGTDTPGSGPECQGSCSTGETAVGIIQWTVLTSKNMNNIASQFIPGCLEDDPTTCAPLSAYSGWSAQQFWDDWNSGTKQFQKTLTEICNVNRDGFLHSQMEVAKKQYLEPLLETYPWLEERPSCVQGAVMHLRVWGADTDWCSSYEGSTDEEIIMKVRNVIANTGSTAGAASGNEGAGRAYNEPQIALEILSGGMSADDVEQWVRTKDTNYLSFSWRN